MVLLQLPFHIHDWGIKHTKHQQSPVDDATALSISAIIMSEYPEEENSVQHMQEVDSSRLGSHVLSPIFNSASPSLPVESHPICIPAPYTDLGHDFSTLPFYSPTLLGYGAATLSDCPSVRQPLSPTLFWPPHSHVSSFALHQQQTRLQQNHPASGTWAELIPHDHVEEENRYVNTKK